MWKTATAGGAKFAKNSQIELIFQIDCPTRRSLEGQLPGGSCWKQLRRLSDGVGVARQAAVRHTGGCCDGLRARCFAKSEKGEKEKNNGDTGGAP